MRTLVCLPTYNEAENIGEILLEVRRWLPDADIVVLDDNSPDGTADIAQKVSDEVGGVIIIRRPAKAGLGAAYRAGFRWGLDAGYQILVEMDSDFSHSPSDLPALVDSVKGGADLAIGSRYVPGGKIPDWSLWRRMISRFGNLYARVVLGMSVRDATAGFRAFKREALGQINLDKIAADGYGFQVEMAYRVEENGGRIVEVPIEFRDRVRGESKMSLKIVVEALLLVSWWGFRDRTKRFLYRAR